MEEQQQQQQLQQEIKAEVPSEAAQTEGEEAAKPAEVSPIAEQEIEAPAAPESTSEPPAAETVEAKPGRNWAEQADEAEAKSANQAEEAEVAKVDEENAADSDSQYEDIEDDEEAKPADEPAAAAESAEEVKPAAKSPAKEKGAAERSREPKAGRKGIRMRRKKQEDPRVIPRKPSFFEHDFRDEEVDEKPPASIKEESEAKAEDGSAEPVDAEKTEAAVAGEKPGEEADQAPEKREERPRTSRPPPSRTFNRGGKGYRSRGGNLFKLDAGSPEGDGRWSHDRFDLNDQQPKSEQEIVKKYGYDIRKESKLEEAAAAAAATAAHTEDVAEKPAKPERVRPKREDRDTNGRRENSGKYADRGENGYGRGNARPRNQYPRSNGGQPRRFEPRAPNARSYGEHDDRQVTQKQPRRGPKNGSYERESDEEYDESEQPTLQAASDLDDEDDERMNLARLRRRKVNRPPRNSNEQQEYQEPATRQANQRAAANSYREDRQPNDYQAANKRPITRTFRNSNAGRPITNNRNGPAAAAASEHGQNGSSSGYQGRNEPNREQRDVAKPHQHQQEVPKRYSSIRNQQTSSSAPQHANNYHHQQHQPSDQQQYPYYSHSQQPQGPKQPSSGPNRQGWQRQQQQHPARENKAPAAGQGRYQPMPVHQMIAQPAAMAPPPPPQAPPSMQVPGNHIQQQQQQYYYVPANDYPAMASPQYGPQQVYYTAMNPNTPPMQMANSTPPPPQSTAGAAPAHHGHGQHYGQHHQRMSKAIPIMNPKLN